MSKPTFTPDHHKTAQALGLDLNAIDWNNINWSDVLTKGVALLKFFLDLFGRTPMKAAAKEGCCDHLACCHKSAAIQMEALKATLEHMQECCCE